MIDSTLIDNCISRVRSGQEFVNLLHALGHSNQAIQLSIEHYLDLPTLIGEFESIIINSALKHLHINQY